MEKALEMLQALAAKLGTTAEALWPHAVRYTAIKSLASAILCFITAGMFLYLGRVVLQKVAKAYPDDEDNAEYLTIQAATAIITGIVVLLMLDGAGQNFVKFIEPVGATVHQIIGAVK